LLKVYRDHFPDIELNKTTSEFLKKLKVMKLGTALISDGRAKTQRNKLKALGLEKFFDLVIISEEIGTEKPSKRNFQTVEDFFGNGEYVYIADNYKKDFVAPNELGWVTVALKDNGQNIHKANLKQIKKECLPGYTISSFKEIFLTFTKKDI
jgi:putative hydrolase of the HAD superfamily